MKLTNFTIGATLISLFAVLNKVAGAYGMLAVLLAGGNALSQPIGQLTMYVYSIASLVVFIWGLQKIGEVRSLPFSSSSLPRSI
jgi:predicted DNA repair protein MutK